MQKLLTSLRAFGILALLFGLFYPLLIAGIGRFGMPFQANGSLLFTKDNILVGSALIGQKFTAADYFHSRPSYIDYDAAISGSSNFGPSSKKLIAWVAAEIKKVQKENNLMADIKVPADMVLFSASGLDPHISLENALLQLSRVAKNRRLPEATIKKLILADTDHDFIGIWGQAGVNVLKLNMALDHHNSKN